MKSIISEKTARIIVKSNYYFIFAVLVAVFYCNSVFARPSGGPYGPIRQSYDLPKVSGTIYYAAADGNAEASGKTLDEPTTIASALERVVSGDAIVMRGGTYRTGGLRFNQGITIQPYMDEEPVFKGTYVAENWERQRNGLWGISWNRLFPDKPADWWRRQSFGRSTPLHRFNNDMVFVDGRFLQSAGWEGEVDENSYFIDYEAQMVYISIDPNDKLIEITAYDNALTRTIQDCHGKKSDGKGFLMRGITFTQYAFRAIEIEGKDPEGLSDEADHGKDVIGTTIENCTITFCSRVAAYLRGDNLVLRHCLVSDTSTEGIFILSSNDVLLERNIFRRNNIEKITGYYPSAVKIFNQCYRVKCNDNLVIDHPNSNGIWYDVGNVDGVFVNNWLVNIGQTDRRFNRGRFWPSENGFFFEISKGAICAGNVFVNCDQGIFVLNSNDVHIYNNTLVNSTVCIGRTNRSAEGDHFGWHPSTGPDVDNRDGHIFVNNLLTGDENYHRPLLALWQMPVLCDRLNKSQIEQLDYNVYVRRSKTTEPLIYWSPVQNERCQEGYESLTELRKTHAEFEDSGLYLLGYNGPLFKSIELGDYRLLQSSQAIKSSKQLPDEVLKHLGPENDKPFVGAYSPVE